MFIHRRLLSIFALLLISLVIIGCDEPITSTTQVQSVEYTDAKLTGNVTFIIKDNSADTIIPGVTVEIIGAIDDTAESVIQKIPQIFSRTSNSKGLVLFTELTVGTYHFKISKKEFEPIYKSITVSIQNKDNSEVPIVPDNTERIELHKQSAAVEFYVKYNDEDNNKLPAQNAEVKVELLPIDSWVNKSFTVKADANGKISLGSLPADVSYSLKVIKFTADNGKTYFSDAVNQDAIASGDVVYLSDLVLSEIKGHSFDLDYKNLDNLSETDSLVFTFSQPVDVSKLKIGEITVTKNGTKVSTTTSFTNDNKTMIIAPNSGIWKKGTEYRVIFNVTSVSEQDESGVYPFTVAHTGDIGIVENIYFASNVNGKDLIDTNTFNKTDTSIHFVWNSVENASGYTIYTKTSEDENFTYSGEPNGDDTTYTWIIPQSERLTAVDFIKIYISAHNTEAESPFVESQIITVVDNKKPFLDNLPADFQFDSLSLVDTTVNNTLPDHLVKLAYTTFTFNEKMDTTLLANINTKTNPSELHYKQVWSSDEQQLTINVMKIDSVLIQDAEDQLDTVLVDFSNLTDISGNPINSDSLTVFPVLPNITYP